MEITTIIPVHEFNEKVSELLKAAIKSVAVQEQITEKRLVIVVFASALETNEDWNKFVGSPEKEWDENLDILYIKNEGKTDFQSQINLGVKNVETPYFSILEFDDEYSTTYFKIFSDYINSSEFKKVDIFLSMIVETNDKEQALKLTNETVWSRQFVGENGTMGYLNANSLNQYTDFKICGATIKKDEFIAMGGLKSNIKLTFQYEFLLRALTNASKIYTVPKIGYKHFTTREGSLFYVYGKTMNLKERKFWFDTAKKESNFFTDREIDFVAFEKTKNI